MPIDKACISRPLEAGQSLLDTQLFSQQVICALEYVSSRLARKNLNISLVVVHGDETTSITPSTPSFASPSSSTSDSPASPFKRSPSAISHYSVSSSISASTSSTSSTASRPRTYPSPPASSYQALSPQSPTHYRRPETPTPPNPYGITLLHASTLTIKSENILRRSIAKAEKKFSIGSNWLSTSSTAPANELIPRSLLQNEVLFSSEGLTLLAMDHIYVFKCRLQTYSRTRSSCDLTSTVDELRRLVLAQHCRQITLSDLMETYEGLDIELDALAQVEERYKVAYGDFLGWGGVVRSKGVRSIHLRTSVGLPRTQHPTRTQQLRLQTNFERDNHMEDRGPHFRGPATPNRGDDITPITQGEWSFLMVNRDRPAARIMTIETY